MDDLTKRLARDLDGTFPDLVEATQRNLYWGLRRMTGDAQHAEDLSQEAMIRAYKALRSYEKDRILALRIEPWIWTIALNLGRNHLRDRSRRPSLVEQKDDGPPVHDIDVPDSQVWEHRLSHLSRPQRTAVVLRHVVGLGIDEIAQATGRAAGTCKADIHRGLKKLRTIMEEENEH